MGGRGCKNWSNSGLTDLCGHDPLSLRDEVALAAGAVAEAAVPLVALQPRDQPVVPAARALGAASVVAAAAAAVVLLCREKTFLKHCKSWFWFTRFT